MNDVKTYKTIIKEIFSQENLETRIAIRAAHYVKDASAEYLADKSPRSAHFDGFREGYRAALYDKSKGHDLDKIDF